MDLKNCPLCGFKNFKTVFNDWGYDQRSYQIVVCAQCGFRYLNPQPSDEELKNIYATYYGGKDEAEKTASHLMFRRPVFKDLCRQMEGFRKPGARLLDVGCGNGEFLVMAKQEGWSVSGIEIAESAAEFAKNKRGLDVRAGSFENLPFSENSFDAVTILDVLEHVRSPKETLRSVHKILKPGGALVVRVPNTPFQLWKAKVQRWRHGDRFTTLASPLHLNHFDARSLRSAVEKAGFSVESIGPGTADGEGLTLLLKKSYVLFSKLLLPTGIQTANILSLIARK